VSAVGLLLPASIGIQEFLGSVRILRRVATP
jgi:hypothetical protein